MGKDSPVKWEKRAKNGTVLQVIVDQNGYPHLKISLEFDTKNGAKHKDIGTLTVSELEFIFETADEFAPIMIKHQQKRS